MVVIVAYLAATHGPAPVSVVAAGDIVNVSYTGTFTNGTVFDSNVGGHQLQFTAGAGQLIKGFDDAVIGMRLGEEKNVTIPVNEAYGEINPALIVSVPSNTFGNHTVQVGSIIRRSLNNTQVQQGVVTAVNATNVTVDFNPPLAGQTLIFQIKVLSIKKG